MNRSEDLYIAETDKSVKQFVSDLAQIVKQNDFVINNADTMSMKETFRKHGGQVSDAFDLHMIQLCKPTKADASLSFNAERSILMPKFVMVFSKDGKTQIRFMSYGAADISEMVPDDSAFPESLAQTFAKIRSMIDQAK